MKNNELIYWLALQRIFGIGVRTLQKLKKIFPSWQELFAASPQLLAELKLLPQTIVELKNPPWRLVEQDLTWLEKNPSYQVLTLDDANYPAMLAEIHAPPFLIFVRGDISVVNSASLAVVGSRNPTNIGLENAKFFAAELAQVGLMIVSGLAIGIDTAAHIGALEVSGKTAAVLGTGINIIYPQRNRSLADKILDTGGVLISEFPLNTAAQAINFPQRNRIISGLSLGTLVVEATERSGSLITAQYALEQGREVFAIPGSISNPLTRGCHKLLRDGAKLVEKVDDILSELVVFNNVLPHNKAVIITADKKNKLDPNQQKLLECVDHNMSTIDGLVEQSNFSVAEVMSILTVLELEGLVEVVPGGYVRIG